MQQEFKTIITNDGSATLNSEKFDALYHSHWGALQESKHVFIEAGLKHWKQHNEQNPIHILEIGLGTGLNFLLTLDNCKKNNSIVKYEAFELFPISFEDFNTLNYEQYFSFDIVPIAYQLFDPTLQNQTLNIVDNIFQCTVEDISTFHNERLLHHFDIIYFDAFAPGCQPELWSLSMFQKMYLWSKKGAVLVTYCAKGQVRRNIIEAGFSVERIPGPLGKREMLRATKK